MTITEHAIRRYKQRVGKGTAAELKSQGQKNIRENDPVQEEKDEESQYYCIK